MTGSVARVRTEVLAKLNGRRRAQIVGLEHEHREIRDLLEGTIESGEGNSCLIIGPRSTGKTTLVENTIEEMEGKYPGQFITVRLSGFCHGEDKMALREVSRQLDCAFAQSAGKSVYDIDTLEKKSMTETVASVLSLFESGVGENSVAVVFILEELDRFAQSPRQTLLYNLLEIAQTSSVGVAVIGLTARINSRETLEKRVRSRFSQRVYQFRRPSNIDDFWRVVRNNLTVSTNEYGQDGAQWNDHIQQLYESGGTLYDLVEHIYYTSKDHRQLNALLLYAVSRADPFINPTDLTKYRDQQRISDTQSFVDGLSELELALLICAARAEVKLESDTMNFNLVYDEYAEVAKEISRSRAAVTTTDIDSGIAMGARAGYRIWSKEAARAAWERLEAMDLILTINSAPSKAPTSAVADEIKMVKVDAGLLELGHMIGRGHTLFEWTKL